MTRFTVASRDAEAIWLCLFDGAREARLPMARASGSDWTVEADAPPGTRYGLRADGPWSPGEGLLFDPDKLLVDPRAVELDRRFGWDARLALPRGSGVDTAPLVPKAVVQPFRAPVAHQPPLFAPAGLIYELNVRGFTRLHPHVPPEQRGTVAALAAPAVIAHLQRLQVSAVELMPITAWIDERHLATRGLANAWGYNPVVPMALDPGLCPGGVEELRRTVAALHGAGIGVILDLVFNHTGESDLGGPTLSLRGLDNRTYYAHEAADPGRLVNHTGTGNMLACWRPEVQALVLESLRHFVSAAGIDGVRFDLGTVLARGPDGFDPRAPIFAAIAADPVLGDRVMIAEPWDIGPGGYQLGNFPAGWLEWNDRYRDDVRRFWRGDPHMLGRLATRMTGSTDLFSGSRTRSVSFIAAHDGFTLADLVAYEHRHNEANGEAGRDGHGENLSWNNGVEGPSDDPGVQARRHADGRALLGTLFATRGPIMLTAGDEFGRSQGGNNNAYAQDNETSWIDWSTRDLALEAHAAALAAFRAAHPALFDPTFLEHDAAVASIEWRDSAGAPLAAAGWEAVDAPGFVLEVRLTTGEALTLTIDRTTRRVTLAS